MCLIAGRFTEDKEILVNDLTKLIKLKDSCLGMYLAIISRRESYETHKEQLIAL